MLVVLLSHKDAGSDCLTEDRLNLLTSFHAQERAAAPAGALGAAAAAVPLAALAARIQAVWARCGGEGDAAVAARSSSLALLAGLEVGCAPKGHIALSRM